MVEKPHFRLGIFAITLRSGFLPLSVFWSSRNFLKKTLNKQFYEGRKMLFRRKRGAMGSKTPLGGSLKIWKFLKKKLFLISRPPYHYLLTGCPHNRNDPPVQPIRAAVWKLRPPKDVIFADYFWRILRIAEVNSRVIS